MKTTTFIIAVLFANLTFAQINPSAPANTDWHIIKTTERIAPISQPTQHDRYEVDYELVDYSFVNGDSTILDELNLDYLETLRESERSVIVLDKTLGVKVKLYAVRLDVNTNHLQSTEQ